MVTERREAKISRVIYTRLAVSSSQMQRLKETDILKEQKKDIK